MQTPEENRARGVALPRHSRRLPEAEAHWPTRAALAVDFPQTAPGVAAGRDPVGSPRAPNGSRAGTIANEAAERGAAVRISESRFCFRGESSPHKGAARREARRARDQETGEAAGETPCAGGSRCAGRSEERR